MPERRSRLPGNPEYWESLAQRVERAALGRESASQWLARRAAAVGVTALAAALVLVVVTGVRSGREAPSPATRWVEAVAPADPLGRTISEAEPPRLALLLLGGR